MTFSLISIGFGLLFAAAAATFGRFTVLYPDLWQRLPRARYAGALLGMICLIWSAMLVNAMLEGGLAQYRQLVRIAVPVVGVIVFLHLDYLFARSLGGFFVLVVSYLLHGAFAEDIALRPLYSLCCYAIGLCGLFLIGAPWVLRDCLERAREHSRWRQVLVTSCGVLSGVLIVFAFLR